MEIILLKIRHGSTILGTLKPMQILHEQDGSSKQYPCYSLAPFIRTPFSDFPQEHSPNILPPLPNKQNLFLPLL